MFHSCIATKNKLLLLLLLLLLVSVVVFMCSKYRITQDEKHINEKERQFTIIIFNTYYTVICVS